MGRSVSVPSGAQVVAFNYIEYEDEHDDWSYDDFVENAQHAIRELAPSMSKDKGWRGNEDKIIASNGHADFGISEYCGLVSVWLVPYNDGLAAHWCNQIRAKFMASFSELELIGRASNGEAFFRKVGV